MYQYTYNFLCGRTATIVLGSMHSEPFSMPNRRTPQGGVLSPMIFDITLIPLARIVLTIHSHGSTLYADDIALCVTRGSEGHIENTLQRGLDTLLRHTQPLARTCSPNKSPMLIVASPGKKPSPTPL
ncbi:hypothetical protein HPB48_022737 [Haemaphysalis longicornis]|uniref:Reverse transcriptase domain-containing protein n=1 Tax=Haemaphysalis longicornis TaxID=44386 RepID=A0A9J6FS46_HAELO|nr:hypothetical protein HPB48_022737 [Haemaphysalis longicornis]